jgi:hypothetical protein
MRTLLLAGAVAALSFPTPAAAAGPAKKPNIVFILADDMD